MPDPHSVTAMEVAAKRIADAIVGGEAIAIFGDYDVDGATARAFGRRDHLAGAPLVYSNRMEAVRSLSDQARKSSPLFVVRSTTTRLRVLCKNGRVP